MRAWWLLVACAVAIVAGACGGDGDKRAETVSGTSAPVAPTTSGAAAPTVAPAGPLSGARPPFDARKALLTLDDMPTGFTLDPPDESDDDNAQPCGQPSALRGTAIENVEANFTKGVLGPFVTHAIGVFKSGEGASSFEKAKAAFENCRTWTETDAKGVKTEYRVSPISFPRLGDQTYALRLDLKTEGAVGQADVVLVRRGDVIFLLGNIVAGLGLATVDSTLTEQLARKADDKLQAAR